MGDSPLHWIEISASALRHNLHVLRRKIPKSAKIMAMVKANAYGHGLNIAAPVLAPHVDFFGVNTISEALTIRKLGLKTPILITAPVSPSDFLLVAKHHISLCVHSLDFLQSLSLSRSSISIHLKVNTGMNRLGLSPIELLSALALIKRSPHLTLEGIYTHFHSADTNKIATLKQLLQTVSQTKYLFPAVLAHCANSAAIFNYSQTHLDLVRPGITIYGLSPNPSLTIIPALKPAILWKSKIVLVRNLSTEETVGYGATYTTNQKKVMGLIPLGYSDGLDIRLANKGLVYINNKSTPIIGRVAMNFISLDLSNVANPLGKTVEILGSNQSAWDLAKSTGNIAYEVLTRLSPFIPRLLTK